MLAEHDLHRVARAPPRRSARGAAASGCAGAATGTRRTSAIARRSRSVRSASSMAMPQVERFSRTCAVTAESTSVKRTSSTAGCSRANSFANATSDVGREHHVDDDRAASSPRRA